MIYILNKKVYQGKGEYVGRPSVLGNPFKIGKDGSREHVVDVLYKNWIWRQIKSNADVYDELERLAEIARNGDLKLICWCKLANKDVKCHADIIKAAIEWINEYK